MFRPKILIVDDEPFNIDYLEQELEELNYDTISAVNGQEALDKIKTEPPDLVLLDIMMPVLDGFEVITHLKAEPATRDIPVIIISANNDLRSVVRGIQLGAEDYLPKPFDSILLNARLSSCLEKKQLRDLQQLYLKGLERELDIARDIQLSFLPSELPIVDEWEIGAYLKAAREVAGDFYDAFLLPDGNLVCIIGDVCGKGVGAALFMTLFRSLLRVTCTTDSFYSTQVDQTIEPARRLQYAVSFTNKYISETHGEANMFATVFIGIFQKRDGILSYINCGNEPPLVIKGGLPVIPLLPTGPVLGIISDAQYSVKEIALDKDDILLVFTDGITDALNSDYCSFGTERLVSLLPNGELSSIQLLELIQESLRNFIGTTQQFDDITLLAIRRSL